MYYMKYPGNPAMPYHLDSQVFLFARTQEDAENQFLSRHTWLMKIRKYLEFGEWDEEKWQRESKAFFKYNLPGIIDKT